jgi:hypothetical protein
MPIQKDGDGDDPRLLRLSPKDNVGVVIATLRKGEVIDIGGAPHAIAFDVALGHKLALAPIARGAKIVKYGAPIGSATADIALGDYVHIHNMKSDYLPIYSTEAAT